MPLPLKPLREAAVELGIPEAELKTLIDLKKIRAVFKKGRFYLAPDEMAKVKRVRKTLPESAKPSLPEPAPAIKPPTPPRPQPPRRFGQRSSM